MTRHVAVWPLRLLLVGIVLLGGCDAPPPVANSAVPLAPAPPLPPGSQPAVAPAPPPPASTGQAPLPPETKFGAFAGSIDDLAARPSSAPSPPPSAPATATPDESATERVKAEKGVGIKGRSLDQYEGVVVTPAKAYFSARERIAFEIAVPHALNLYKASEGHAPKTHQEFMEKIVEFNQIKLPLLPQGHKYVYDPVTEQLMVERPKQQ